MFLDLMRKHLKPKEVNDALTKVVEKSPPDFDNDDIGKILSVGSDGNLEWIENGGSSVTPSYHSTLLYTGTTFPSTNVELSAEYDNFDALLFVLGFGNDNSITFGLVPKEIIDTYLSSTYGVFSIASFGNSYCGGKMSSDKKTLTGLYQNQMPRMFAIYGINYNYVEPTRTKKKK